MEIHSPVAYNRESLEFEDFKKFELSSKNFEEQYSSIYVARLTALRYHLLQKVKVKWAQYEVVTLSELCEKNEGNDYIIIGTLYKHQELKPSILRELSEELQITTQTPRTNYAAFKDLIFLEGETLRIKLVGSHMNIQNVVTGIVCAVLGHELNSGEFYVVDWCFPGCNLKPIALNKPLKQCGKILLISGLDLANNTQSLSLNLFSEWISGMIGCTEVQREVASIVCIIIAGNSVRGSIEVYNHKEYFITKAHNEAIFKEAAAVTYKLDNFLASIAQCCPIILMPGEFDPSCHALPQQSLHPCILPQCSRLKRFYGVTNPWCGRINSRIIAGSSGQPILDIMNVSGLANTSPLTWLECTLDWKHYAPTAPDTVPAYPYSKIDPFIITEYPDIYFAGNMDKYDTKLVTANEGQTIRVICIPKFSETQTAVLVDLQDLRSQPVSFSIN
ncbi:PREDICTED: DNA polymerase delta small subunit-like [Dufourea novaeangliae]|uniref:DNA polymerase delta small subunit n=1 Tax=Dufourea novaeangliae TaxID=178035 RepID=A0A154PK73_DUFNO|nr:PREDICTED: DNA polymerase delta small subunit-like [Dufourea novaeangliae]KZC11620.1 DNA polymerase delta small subunit [Dufourea novaeangliae]